VDVVQSGRFRDRSEPDRCVGLRWTASSPSGSSNIFGTPLSAHTYVLLNQLFPTYNPNRIVRIVNRVTIASNTANYQGAWTGFLNYDTSVTPVRNIAAIGFRHDSAQAASNKLSVLTRCQWGGSSGVDKSTAIQALQTNAGGTEFYDVQATVLFPNWGAEFWVGRYNGVADFGKGMKRLSSMHSPGTGVITGQEAPSGTSFIAAALWAMNNGATSNTWSATFTHTAIDELIS